MKKLKTLSFVLSILLVLSFAAFGQQSECKDIDKVFKAQETSVAESDVYESANVCGVCHEKYYQQWKNSLMGQTHTSPIYQTFRAEAVKTRGDMIIENCDRCHAPMVGLSRDASDKLLAEGVNCDFCHTINQLEFYQDPGSYISAPSRVKKGNLDVAKSPYHPSKSDEIMSNPRLCASCHEYEMVADGKNITVEDTYSQWKDSSYGKTNRGCVDCHFEKTEGKVANLELAPFRKKGHSHTFGAEKKEQHIKDSVGLAIKPFIKKASRISLIVNNKSQGHAFPGGANYFRHLILTVRGYDSDDNQIWSYATIFGRWYADRFGNKTYYPWDADKVAYNKLLRPDRLEEVTYNLTKKIKVYKVVATLDYWAMPPELVKQFNLKVEPIRIASTSARPKD